MKTIVTTVSSNGVSSETTSASRRIARRFGMPSVNVEVGNGAIAPRVAIQRSKQKTPVKVEVGNGAIAPKVAIFRAKLSQRR